MREQKKSEALERKKAHLVSPPISRDVSVGKRKRAVPSREKKGN